MGRRRSPSVFSMFFACFSGGSGRGDGWEDQHDEYVRSWTSDEDRMNWVAERRINERADEFIAKFHKSRVYESEAHLV